MLAVGTPTARAPEKASESKAWRPPRLEYRYDVPFKFTGKINRVTFNLGPQQLTAEDRKQLPAVADALARAKD